MKIDNNKISSFALATNICANSLAWLKIFPKMLPVIVVLSFFTILVCRRRDFKIRKNALYALGVIVVVYYSFFLSFFHPVGYNFSNNVIMFTVLCLPNLIISTIPYDFKSVIKYILLLFAAPMVYLVDVKTIALQQEDIPGFLMGISYGILPYALSALYILFDKYIGLLYKMFATGVLVVCMIFLLGFGSRGPQVAILLFFSYLFYLRYKHKRRMLQVLFFVLIIVAFIFNTFLLSGDTGVYFLDKMAALSNDGDVSNGRLDFYAKALTGFADSPIIGKGIGTFIMNGVPIYPHNIFLQMLYESGLIYTIIVSIPIFAFVLRLLNKNLCDYDKKITMFLICASLVGLLLSYQYWGHQTMWLLIGYGISSSYKRSIVK